MRSTFKQTIKTCFDIDIILAQLGWIPKPREKKNQKVTVG